MTKKMFLEFMHHKVDSKKIEDNVKEIWKNAGNRVKDIETIEIYVKTEDGMCYYIINEDMSGNFFIGELE